MMQRQFLGRLCLGVVFLTIISCSYFGHEDPRQDQFRFFSGCNQDHCQQWATQCQLDCDGNPKKKMACNKRCDEQIKQCQTRCLPTRQISRPSFQY